MKSQFDFRKHHEFDEAIESGAIGLMKAGWLVEYVD